MTILLSDLCSPPCWVFQVYVLNSFQQFSTDLPILGFHPVIIENADKLSFELTSNSARITDKAFITIVEFEVNSKDNLFAFSIITGWNPSIGKSDENCWKHILGHGGS